jgi:ABC-type antimicrobial peptide transport system permease subunit
MGSSWRPAWRLTGTAVTFASLLAVVHCAIGLYSMLSFAVSARWREIALRVALGARVADVVRALCARAGMLLLLGGPAGLVLALLATRLIAGLVFGVALLHPGVYIAAATSLAMVSVIACWVPARRAMRVQPRETLAQV